DRVERARGTARLRKPLVPGAERVQDLAAVADGVDVAGSASPNAVERRAGSGRERGEAEPTRGVNDGEVASDGEDVAAPAAPDRHQIGGGADRHPCAAADGVK